MAAFNKFAVLLLVAALLVSSTLADSTANEFWKSQGKGPQRRTAAAPAAPAAPGPNNNNPSTLNYCSAAFDSRETLFGIVRRTTIIVNNY